MIEESGSESIHLISGSGSGKPKNTWIRWIRIRNTAWRHSWEQAPQASQGRASVQLRRPASSCWPGGQAQRCPSGELWQANSQVSRAVAQWSSAHRRPSSAPSWQSGTASQSLSGGMHLDRCSKASQDRLGYSQEAEPAHSGSSANIRK